MNNKIIFENGEEWIPENTVWVSKDPTFKITPTPDGFEFLKQPEDGSKERPFTSIIAAIKFISKKV